MDDIESTIILALDERRQIEPISRSMPAFDLDAAYRVADSLMAARIANGRIPVGWKIGFTNRTIWHEYGVHAPIWGPVYDSTLHFIDTDGPTAELDVEAFLEPLIEPEIMFRVARKPCPDMDDRELLSCLDGVAHGFEIVQSIYPDWRFSAPDTVAAAAMHGALLAGPFAPIDPVRAPEWVAQLAEFQIILRRDGVERDRGEAANVLGGPLSALRHLLAGLEKRPMMRAVEPGDIVSTGTLTRAFPIAAGEIWSTRLEGLPLPGMRLRLVGGETTLASLVDRAAQGRFHLEHPDSCNDAVSFERAVTDGSNAEAALASLFVLDPAGLDGARESVSVRARELAREWNSRLAP